jgi:hypothetical protein
MRHLVKLAVAFLLGAFAASAHAHIEFARVRMLSLAPQADRWTLEFEIHEWENGGRHAEQPPRRASMQIQRVPRCISTKRLYLGTTQEFAQALDAIRALIADGGVHRIGLDADPVPGNRNAYLAVNLRLLGPGTDKQLVWAIGSEGGRDHCPFKYLASR